MLIVYYAPVVKNWLSTNFPYIYACAHAELLQSCLTLFDPTDCSLPGSSVHELLQVRMLERVAMPFSRGSTRLRD